MFLQIFLPSAEGFGQSNPEKSFLDQKALLFKNKVQYDSALYYYHKLGEILTADGDKKASIYNELNICDIEVLTRNFNDAYTGLQKALSQVSLEFPGDPELTAELLQVKGSFFQATGEPDSARALLLNSIRIRQALNGQNDTALHYAFNKLGNLYLSQSEFDSAYSFHKKALDLALKKQNIVNFLTASSYQNVGIACHLKGDFQQAEIYYNESLNLKEQLLSKDDPALAKIYWNLGKFYTDESKYDLALQCYDRSEQLLNSRYDKNNFQFAHVYWNKGNVYTHQGDYVKATSYLSRAYSILEETYGPDNQDVLNLLLDLGFTYAKKGDTTLAIECYTKASKNKGNAGIIKIYRNLGNIYNSMGELDSAARYYNLAIASAKSIFSGKSYDLALCYQYYGEFLIMTNKSKEAPLYYSQAEDIFKQLFGEKNKDLSKIYRLQSDYYITTKEYDLALNKIQSALVALLPKFSPDNTHKNPSIDEIILDIYLQDILVQKAYIQFMMFKQKQDLDDLKASLDVINLAVNVTEEIRKTYYGEESQLNLNNLARKIFDIGIRVTLQLYSGTNDISYLEKAFQFSEKSQAIILLSALRGLEAQTNTNIPVDLKVLENDLSKELAMYYNFLYQERQKKAPDDSKIKFWSDEIFKIQFSHDSVISIYKNQYPEYFRLKFDYSITPADSILALLDQNQAIIEYYIADSLDYLADSLVVGFLLADNHIYGKVLCPKDSLLLELNELHQNFERKDFFNPGQKEFESITSTGEYLYDVLIRPFEKEITGKRLIIVPDGELGYLSFDLLLSEKPPDQSQDYRDLAWLIRSNPISYSSSATIFFENNKQSSRKKSEKVLAFAPSYSSLGWSRVSVIDSAILNLRPLVGTKEEIKSISEIFKTKMLFDIKATETNFKENAGKFGILHLAMHTIIDNHNPLYSKLVFSPPGQDSPDDGLLNTYELFNLQLPGQLAVLSACNTGSGKLEHGEGIISLARGFFYAGIPSVIMTLWEIEDYKSADLMAIFYKNLKEGQPYDIALQRSKIQFLENAGKLNSHPYFWAGYVNIGKTGPISHENLFGPKTLILTGILVVFLLLLIYFFINRRVFFHRKRY